jgi:hypothetical protein
MTGGLGLANSFKGTNEINDDAFDDDIGRTSALQSYDLVWSYPTLLPRSFVGAIFQESSPWMATDSESFAGVTHPKVNGTCVCKASPSLVNHCQ